MIAAPHCDGSAANGHSCILRSNHRGDHMATPTMTQILDFEAAHATTPAGMKTGAITKELGVTALRYYQLLNRHIDTEEALAYDPTTTRRVQRARTAR
jgi:hypothetical protein